METAANPTKPLYMWAGGKTKLIKHYRDIWPEENYDTYVEPFFGGGAVYSWLKTNNPNLKAVIGDINFELVNILNQVKTNLPDFQKETIRITEQYLKLPTDKAVRKEHYYKLRQQYWESEGKNVALLYVLMKLGFNGIWQTCKASNGLYGTPAGLLTQTRSDQIIDISILQEWNKMLKTATPQAVPYNKLKFQPRNSLIYLDPPYRDSYTDYSTGFGDNEQRALTEWALKQTEEGATVLLANRCVEDEDFFESLLPDANFHYFNVTYTAGRRKRVDAGFEAKPAREFLAILKPS